MSICTHTTDCGPLGEVALTVSYKYRPSHNGRGIEPDEAPSATIYWIKVGGVHGVEVDVADDYITDEIIPACVADWNGDALYAAQERADAIRLEQLEQERQAA